MSETYRFRALVDADDFERYDVLAEALQAIDPTNPVEDSSVTVRRIGVDDCRISVRVDFLAANGAEAERTSKTAESELAHRWPTDSARVVAKKPAPSRGPLSRRPL